VSRRHDNKRAARMSRWLRHELVHAAGCSFGGNVPVAHICELDDLVLDEIEALGLEPRRVSVPRSLRWQLGRFIGGAQ